MLENGMQKTRKAFQNGRKMGAKIVKVDRKRGPKIDAKKGSHAWTYLVGQRSVAGSLLRLIISSRLVFRLVFRLVLASFRVLARHVTSRGACIHLSSILRLQTRPVVLLTSCIKVFILSRYRQNCRASLCRQLNARSLKRPMLHTCSGVVSRCEFTG